MKKYLFLISFFFLYSLEAIDRYQLIHLGLLDYQTSEVTSINSHGQICGTYKDKKKSYIFIWNPSYPTFNYSRIRTSAKPLINNKTEIFGCQFLHATNDIWDYEQEVVFCWTNPLSYFTFLNIAGLGFPKEISYRSPFDLKRVVLWGINNHGELVIMNSDSLKEFLLGNPTGFKYQVWIYHKGRYKLIDHPQLYVAFSINNQSEVLGCYYEEINSAHGDHVIATSVYDINTHTVRTLNLPPNSVGRAINDLGEVVGIYYEPGNHQKQGFLYDASGHFLSLEYFIPIKNNNQNLIIGKISGEQKERPAIWEDGQLHRLTDLVSLVDNRGNEWDSLDELIDVNDEGAIIGQGKFNGSRHGFLLRPICSVDVR